MGAGKAPEHLRQEGLTEILLKAEPDATFELDAANRRHCFVVEFELATGIREQRFASTGAHQHFEASGSQMQVPGISSTADRARGHQQANRMGGSGVAF